MLLRLGKKVQNKLLFLFHCYHLDSYSSIIAIILAALVITCSKQLLRLSTASASIQRLITRKRYLLPCILQCDERYLLIVNHVSNFVSIFQERIFSD